MATFPGIFGPLPETHILQKVTGDPSKDVVRVGPSNPRKPSLM